MFANETVELFLSLSFEKKKKPVPTIVATTKRTTINTFKYFFIF